MENQRLLLYFTLFFILYLLWAEWQMDYGPKPETPVAETTDSQPQEIAEVPEAPVAAVEPEAEPEPVTEGRPKITGSQRIRVITDVLEVEIDTRGGDVRRVVLRDYAVTAKNPEDKLVLMDDTEVNFFVAQSGLVSVNADSAPTHNAVFSAENSVYRLAEGEDKVSIPLSWTGADGVRVTKLYTFHRGSYVIDLEHIVKAGDADWSGSQYMQLVRSPPLEEDKSAFIYTYTGGVIYNDDIKYEKIDFDDIADQNLKNTIGDGCLNLNSRQSGCELTGGWLAMMQHYFPRCVDSRGRRRQPVLQQESIKYI